MNDQKTEKPPFILSDTAYLRLKWIIVIVMPACGTLYFGLAKIWEFPAGEQILGTLLVAQAFLGTIFAISSSQYGKSDLKYSGDINIAEDSIGEKTVQVSFNEHPAEFVDKKEVTFKVNPPSETPSR